MICALVFVVLDDQRRAEFELSAKVDHANSRSPFRAVDRKLWALYIQCPMRQPTRALSIRQPFVELILRGDKTKEFRSQPTNMRERVWLYASDRPHERQRSWMKVEKEPGELPTGLIPGSVEIVDCRPDKRYDWAYMLANPKRLRTPRGVVNQPQPRFWIPQFE